MSGPRRWPRIPRAHVDSPNLSTSSARTPGPAMTNGTGPAEPLQRDHVAALSLETAHHLAAPFLSGTRRPRGLGDDRLRTQDGVTIAKKCVAVGDALVRAAGDAQNRLAAPHVREREREAV